jgi:hypothetical protein
MKYGRVVSRFLFSLFVLLTPHAFAQKAPAMAPNSDPTYQQLRNLALGGEAVAVNNFALKRDAGTFHLRAGTVCFAAAVQGKVTGAVFVGDGNFILTPPIASEVRSLSYLTREEEFSEKFSELVLRFTDATYDEIRKAGSPASGSCPANLLEQSKSATRHDRMLKYNLEARILEDVLSPEPGGLFVAFVHGKRYSDKLLYVMDPHGAQIGFPVAPEEIELMTYDENKYGIWAAFHYSGEYANGRASGSQKNWVADIQQQQLDTEIEKNAHLNGKATTTFVAVADGVRVVPFNLFSTLRVQSVTEEGGAPLAFIQEDKDDDYQFYVILSRALKAGEKYALTTVYSGKDAVANEGGGNYYPVARLDWYPANGDSFFGNYTNFEMAFRVPKGMKIAATGTLLSESNEGDRAVSHWRSAVPQVVAGFNFGRFKREEFKLEKLEYTLTSYANQEPPDFVKAIQHVVEDDLPQQAGPRMRGLPQVALGSMDTTVLLKKAMAEGQIALQLYSDYFGPMPYKSMAISQQTALNYGQAWPGLVWLPISYFFDTTVRHGLGMDDPHGYFKVVAPHEVAHQWWGHMVGFGSYRDQWMSEGFAELSASIFLQNVYAKEPQKFHEFWKDERELLTERNKEGFRAIDVGPLTMGYRLNSSRTGVNVTRRLIYPKGAYVLHMVRMMMWDRKTGEQNFKATMQDFARTYANRTATTEDFKAMVEKHMSPEMNLEGNGRMDWFFNEYVYGTALPSYKFEYTFDTGADGDVVFGFKVTQSGVDDKFRMLVPVYLELADGRIVNVGRARLAGNTTVEEKVPFKGLKDKPRRALINYNEDVLATSN